ncbi:MAG: MOSC domain-containing protein [Myxococcota bacterium]
MAARGVNLAGDDQADRNAHGGVHKAVYAYAIEDYEAWREEGFEVEPGTFGENLTLEGLDPNTARIGDRWSIGSAVFEVSEPRVPCFKLGVRMGMPTFVRRFAQARRPGTYLRIVQEGTLQRGDAIEVVSQADDGLTVVDVFDIYFTRRADAAQLLEVPTLSDAWKAWARKRVG